MARSRTRIYGSRRKVKVLRLPAKDAALKALEDEPWIQGVFVDRMDWFDQYRRSPEYTYFDATFESSPRSKSAEEVIKLWFGIH